MISSRYTNLQYPTPPSILNVANRTEIHASTRPPLGKLEPGTAQVLAGEPEKHFITYEERITFSNGGSIADLPNQEGLLLTTPEGEQITLKNSGFILPNPETHRMEVHVNVPNLSGDGGSMRWIQGFNPDGTVELKRHREYSDQNEVSAKISPNGSLSAQGKWEFGDYSPEARLESGALVLDDDINGYMAFSPPVPLEWLIGT